MKMWNAAEEAKYKVQGIMLNLDNTAHKPFGMKSIDAARAWAAQFKGTHVTDIVMNIAEGQCVFPCKEFGWYGAKYLQTVENGHPVDYKGMKPWYDHFMDGYDYLEYLSKALPEAGINMWLSIRMGDQHDRGDGRETSTLFSDYYHNNPQNRRVQYPSKSIMDKRYFKCQDYEKEAVRKLYLGLMDEALDRYDVYGFQLEWQREIKIWQIGGEYRGTEILTQFHRDAKAIITKYEKKYGHKIKFSVQVAPDDKLNYDLGLDVITWAREGLIDMVVPKGRHNTTCNEIPVRHWKNLLAPYNVEVVPDIEHRVKCVWDDYFNTVHDIETYAGTAALYLSQGADRIQTYNLLVPMDHIFKEEDKTAEYDPDLYIPEWDEEGKGSVRSWWEVFTAIGSYDKLMTMKRKVIPTLTDTFPNWGSRRPRDEQLPMPLDWDNTGRLIRIGMGDIPEGSKVTLRIASNVIDADNPPVVYVNSHPAKYVGVGGKVRECYTRNQMYCYELPKEVFGDMYAVCEMQAPFVKGSEKEYVSMVIDYAEIVIEPAK